MGDEAPEPWATQGSRMIHVAVSVNLGSFYECSPLFEVYIEAPDFFRKLPNKELFRFLKVFKILVF